MTTEENKAVWAEIDSMRKELDNLKIRRNLLHDHLESLRVVAAELQDTHSKVETMAREVQQHLEGNTE